MKNAATPAYRLFLQEAFARRKEANPAYSHRAFSRQLGIHHGSLQAVMKGRRPFPLDLVNQAALRLGLSASEKAKFLESIVSTLKYRGRLEITRARQATLLEESRHASIIAEWEYAAILSLLDVPEFKPDPTWVGARLGITARRSQECLEALIATGFLIRQPNGRLLKSSPAYRTTDNVSSDALRRSHAETLQHAALKMDSVPIKFRDNSSITIALDPKKLPMLKALSRRYRREFIALAEKGERTEVYQLAIHLFPWTQVTTKKGNCK